MSEQQQSFESWCIVELMGHQRMAGYVTEATIAGGAFVRVDVPEGEGQAAYSRLLNPSAIYALNPCDEATARAAAQAFRPKPVQAWELPRQLPAEPDESGVHEDFVVDDHADGGDW